MWTNPDGNVPLSMIDRAYERAGLDSISYVPSHAEMNLTDWPTIEEMTQVPYIIPTWSFVRETPAFVTDDIKFACGTGSDQRPPGRKLAMVNHVLYQNRIRSGQRFPNVREELTNAATGMTGALLSHLDACYTAWGRRPNFVMVDFFDRGNVFLAQDIINGNQQANEKQKEKEKAMFAKEVEDGRKRAGITEDQVRNGQELVVFTFTRTTPPLVKETQGVVNAGRVEQEGGECSGV
ncbi:hypothetical protein EV426DRAFT_702890 [Tirmania nivea]|nr:hypothetical protein EV426DRAFT_702890 [Tirmania nivea]